MLRKTLRVVDLRGATILRQLQLEELLLRHTNDNFFIVNKNMNYRAIVMGFSAKPVELLDTDRVQRDNIPVLRRFTGGGTVVVDHNTFFASFIMNDQDVDSRPYPRELMAWTAKYVYSPVFQQLLSPDSPDQFALLEHDYVIGEKKFGGNAQTITKNRFVHHTSFLWDFNPANMEYLKLPKKRPDYRRDRKHTDFLRPLKTCIPSLAALESSLIAQLGSIYDIQHSSLEEIEALERSLQTTTPDFVPRTNIEVIESPP